MAHPLYLRVRRLFRGRKALASLATLLLILLVIIVPLLGFAVLVAREALNITETVRPWAEQAIQQPGLIFDRFQNVPLVRELEPYREQVLSKTAQLVEGIGNFVLHSLSATTKGTLTFFFQFFLLVYTMFFFLIDGQRLLQKIMYYLPLPHEDEARMVDKFVSVTRATLKGSLVIGVVQGSLAGLGFLAVGIPSAAFWGTVMAVLSIIPAIGSALVWVPAVIYLFATGEVFTAMILGVWCVAIVGTVDNFMRPWLIGKDTKMPDLLILLGTLGGLMLFGAAGFIVGPIVAALFVTAWDIYGRVFKNYLPGEAAVPPG